MLKLPLTKRKKKRKLIKVKGKTKIETKKMIL